MSAQRDAWGETLVEIAGVDQRVVVVDGDLANSTKADLFAAAHPERFVEIGIAEQNMVGVAFGMSTLGYRPWLSSFAVFLTHRALDQVRMLVSQTRANVKIAGSYSGLLNGSSGKTHQDIEDLAIMRAMPGMTVLAPADEHEMRAATRWAAEHDGPVYLRIARDAVDPVFGASDVLDPTSPTVIVEGHELTIVSTGVQTSRCVQAVELLRERGLDPRLVHVPMLKPVDGPALLDLVGSGPIVTVEEHSIIGGLGSLVSELVAESGRGGPVLRIGLDDAWSESGPSGFLLDKYGLSPRRVVERVLRWRS